MTLSRLTPLIAFFDEHNAHSCTAPDFRFPRSFWRHNAWTNLRASAADCEEETL